MTDSRGDRDALLRIRTFVQLFAFLRDELEWPIESEDFEDTYFEYTPAELGLDETSTAAIERIRRLRPLSASQPWGVYFIDFERKRLPVVALRRILSSVVLKKRASVNSAERAAWERDDLLFISAHGDDETRHLTFAHFSDPPAPGRLPMLRVLGWDDRDSALHLDAVAEILRGRLRWPEDESDAEQWRNRWSSAFVLRHREVVNTSRELALRLAELATAIRSRVRTILEVETSSGPVTQLMGDLQKALVSELEPDDFADMYAQTVAYGLLSARIAHPKTHGEDATLEIPLTNPFLRELMGAFMEAGGGTAGGAQVVDYDELGVNEVVDLLDQANIEAVLRDFGDRNPLEDPVIHFYELFLREYDPKRRMERGVFFTPYPVVNHLVESVDRVLRDELGLVDGLADVTTWREFSSANESLSIPPGVDPDEPVVQILDPATGTGTFLVQVIDRIYRTVSEKLRSAGLARSQAQDAWNAYVDADLLPRLHGFELLMAPYAIAHLKVGLKLLETGYEFNGAERAHIYLANTLEPPADSHGQMDLIVPALAHEADAVGRIKSQKRFTVVVGNPPYSNFGTANQNGFVAELLAEYKLGLAEKKLNLDDDFIKFLRFAHWQIERSGVGVVGVITNSIYLDGITHRRLRESLLETFSTVEIVDLHGNARRAERAPDGGADENVFDIMQGVATAVLGRMPGTNDGKTQLAHLQGSRADKYASLERGWGQLERISISPTPPYYLFSEDADHPEYWSWTPLNEVFDFYSSPIQTKRDGLTIHIDEHDLECVLDDLSTLPESEIRDLYSLAPDGRDWKLPLAVEDVTSGGGWIQSIYYKPFDSRFTYYSGRTKGFLAYPRKAIMRHLLHEGALGVVFKRQAKEDPDGYSNFFIVDRPFSEGLFAIDPRGREYVAPIRCQPNEPVGLLFESEEGTSNVTGPFHKAVANSAGRPVSPEEVVAYLYALVHSGEYRRRYQWELPIDFPRIPVASSAALTESLVTLGSELMDAHLLSEESLEGETEEPIGGKPFVVEKVTYDNRTIWLDRQKSKGFPGVPREVWDFKIGGYQVVEKWLKGRAAKGGKTPRPGRVLGEEDVLHIRRIVGAVSTTLRRQESIDQLIERHGGWPRAFEGRSSECAD